MPRFRTVIPPKRNTQSSKVLSDRQDLNRSNLTYLEMDLPIMWQSALLRTFYTISFTIIP